MTQEEFDEKKIRREKKSECEELNSLLGGMILEGPLTINVKSQNDWHLRVEMTAYSEEFQEIVTRILPSYQFEKLDVIHMSVVHGSEFRNLTESEKNLFLQAVDKFKNVEIQLTKCVSNVNLGFSKYDRNTKIIFVNHATHYVAIDCLSPQFEEIRMFLKKPMKNFRPHLTLATDYFSFAEVKNKF